MLIISICFMEALRSFFMMSDATSTWERKHRTCLKQRIWSFCCFILFQRCGLESHLSYCTESWDSTQTSTQRTPDLTWEEWTPPRSLSLSNYCGAPKQQQFKFFRRGLSRSFLSLLCHHTYKKHQAKTSNLWHVNRDNKPINKELLLWAEGRFLLTTLKSLVLTK